MGKVIIPAPDIDRMARAIYAPQLKERDDEIRRLKAENRSLRGDLQKLGKDLAKAAKQVKHFEDVREQMRERSHRLVLENVGLRRRLAMEKEKENG